MRIERARADAKEFLTLYRAREAYAAVLYPAESNHLFDVAKMGDAKMNFFGVWMGGVVVGCGGFWEYADYVEIKSMWVEPHVRGQKIGVQLLGVIEREAMAKGFTLSRLETGIRQPEALGLYSRSGYIEVGPFGDYRLDPLSVFMEKAL